MHACTLSGLRAAKLFRHACNSICSNNARVYSKDEIWPEQRRSTASLAVKLASSVCCLDGAPEQQIGHQQHANCVTIVFVRQLSWRQRTYRGHGGAEWLSHVLTQYLVEDREYNKTPGRQDHGCNRCPIAHQYTRSTPGALK